MPDGTWATATIATCQQVVGSSPSMAFSRGAKATTPTCGPGLESMTSLMANRRTRQLKELIQQYELHSFLLCTANHQHVEFLQTLFANRATEIIQKHASQDSQDPLFLYVAFQNIHTPIEVPKQYIDADRPKGLRRTAEGVPNSGHIIFICCFVLPLRIHLCHGQRHWENCGGSGAQSND